MIANRQWRIASVPEGRLTQDCFTLTESEIPSITDEQVLVRVLWISIDAAGRAWFQADTYRRALQIGDVMPGFAIGEVVKSGSPAFTSGDIVTGDLGWQDYVALDPRRLQRLDADRPLPTYLSVLGITGLTAYLGLTQAGEVRAGDTVVVSGAAGATGSLVGQIAKLMGCRVVGICGSKEKQDWLKTTLGFDATVSHRDADLRGALRNACPDGIDVYFDNVGGPILETVLGLMAPGGRVACCGVVSQYDGDAPETGPRGVPGRLILRNLTMRGFIVTVYQDKFPAALEQLAAWLDDRSLKLTEDVLEGLESAPEGLVGLLGGTNVGKRLIHVGDPAV